MSITSPPTGTWVKGGDIVKIDVSGFDYDGVDRIELYIDNVKVNTINASSGSFNWNTPTSGTAGYSVKAVIYDTGGRSSNANITINVDNTDPSVNIASPANGSWFKGGVSANINVIGNDTGSGLQKVELYLDNATSPAKIFTTSGTDSINGNYNWTLPSSSGTHTISAKAYDQVGRTKTTTISIKVDNDAPVFAKNPSIDGGVDGFVSDGRITWLWTVNDQGGSGIDNCKVKITEDGSVIYNFVLSNSNNSYTHDVKDGKVYTCQVLVTDKVGNSAYSQAPSELLGTIKIDRSVSQVNLPEYPLKFGFDSGEIGSGKAVFIWEPIDESKQNPKGVGISRYEVAITATSNEPTTSDIVLVTSATSGKWQKEFKGLSSDNTYYSWVRGIDKLNNIGPWKCAGPFPSFKVEGPKGNFVRNPSFRASLKNSLNNGHELKFKLRYKKAGEISYNDSSSFTNELISKDLDEGLWNWYLEIAQFSNGVMVADSLETSEIFSFTVDKTPPDGSLSIPTNLVNSQDIILHIKGLSDSLGSPGACSGVKGVYLWNGIESIPPTTAKYYSLKDIPAEGLPWRLELGNDGARTVSMQIVDVAGNTKLVTANVILDMQAPEKPDIFAHTTSSDNIIFKWRIANLAKDFSHFGGDYTLPDGTIVTLDPLKISQTSGEDGINAMFTIAVNKNWANLPVILKVYSVDLAGNKSEAAVSTVYTQAPLGDLQNLPNEAGCQEHKLVWQLVRNSSDPSIGYELWYWDDTNHTEAPTGKLSPFNDQFILTDLGAHKYYRYRLVSINRSGDYNIGDLKTRRVANLEPTKPVPAYPMADSYVGPTFKFQFIPSTDGDGVDQLEYYIHFRKEGQTSVQETVLGPIANIDEADQILTVNLTKDTVYYWYVEVKDSYLNSVTGEREYFASISGVPTRFIVDGTAPVIDAKRPDGLYTNQDLIGLSVKDNLSGIKEVSYQRINDNGDIIAEGQVPLAIDPTGKATGFIELVEGKYNLRITAIDNAENRGSVSLNNLWVDLTKPELSNIRINLGQNEKYYLLGKGQADVSWTANDGQTGIKGLEYWLIDQQGEKYGNTGYLALSPNLENYSYSLELAGMNGKVYTLAMTVLDLAGNRSNTIYPGKILIDRTSPEVSLAVTGWMSYGSNYYTSDLKTLTVFATVNEDESAHTIPVFALIDSGGTEISPWSTWEIVQKTQLTAGQKYRIACRVFNEVGLKGETQSEEFIYDNSSPDVALSGPSGILASGEQAIFKTTIIQSNSPVVEYRLAIGINTGTSELTSKIPGNTNGWLALRPGMSSSQFKLEVPAIDDGTYYPTLVAVNAVGLEKTINGSPFIINNNQERVIVNDQGPFTMFSDRLTGWWRYTGIKPVTGYEYEIIGPDGEVVHQGATNETTITIKGLKLENGKQYKFKVTAVLSDQTIVGPGLSPGITVDTTPPTITDLKTPAYINSNNIHFEWSGEDQESQVNKVQVALGSDYYQTDITGGWVELNESPSGLSCGIDGAKLKLQSGQRYYLTIRLTNGAGLSVEKVAPAIMVDDTPPPVPVVNDQGAYINLTQALEANWIWSENDPESNSTYQWAFVESKDEINDATQWHDGDSSMKISLAPTDYPRVHGRTYYIAVKATNGAGLTSIGFSNGIMADATAPIIPKVILYQAVGFGQDKKEVMYITNTQDLQLLIDSLDPESNIDGYQYAYGTWEQIETAQKFETKEPEIDLDQPQISETEITVFKGECYNGADLKSQAGYSTGVILDTGAPKIIDVRGSVSGNLMVFDWGVEPSVSPVAWYEVALVDETGVNVTPENWIKIGLNRTYTVNVQDRQDGNYYLIIRACNQAGTYSRRDGTINEWGISPRITLDRTPPVLKGDQFKYPEFAAAQIKVQTGAADDLSGIKGYQYALGTRNNPFEYSNGWVDVDKDTNLVEFTIPTRQVPHRALVYVTVRAQDKVGLFAEALVSSEITIDHSVPTKPEVTAKKFTNINSEISEINYVSEDPESGLTNYRLGVVSAVGEAWLYTQEGKITDFSGVISGMTLEEAKTYLVAIQTMNGAGEWSDIGYSDPITVDTTPPQISFPNADRVIVVNPITGEQPPLNIEYKLSEAANVSFVQTAGDGDVKTIVLNGVKGDNYYPFKESKPQLYTINGVPIDLASNKGNPALEPQVVRVNAQPQISIDKFISTTPGAEVRLTAIIHDNDREERDIISYQWDPGDKGSGVTGSTSEWIMDENGQYVIKLELKHKYYFGSNNNDTYSASLIVTDKDGGKATVQVGIKVANTTKGTLYADEVWSGEHRLYGDVVVPEGIKLRILPGTKVISDNLGGANNCPALIVKGNIIAEAGAEFSFVDESVEAGWKGIYVEGEAVFEGITVMNAQRGLTIVDDANVLVNNCIFRSNNIGIHVYANKPVITKTLFQDNFWYGIKEDAGGRPKVTDCRFVGNSVDYYSQVLTELTMEQLDEIDGNSGNYK